MRTPSLPLKPLAFASVLLVASSSALAQSAYFEAVTNLNPVVYLPLQETNQPPIADVETNYGSLGPAGNAIYSSANVTKAQGGATADGDASVLDTDAQGGFLAVPTANPRTAVQSPKFTVEAWVNPAEVGRNFEGILCQSGGDGNGSYGGNNQGGFCLSENYIAYLDNANMVGFDFHVYNGVGHGGAEVIVPFNVQVSTWYHLVGVYDGTNCWLYLNGTNMTAAGYGYQIPMSGTFMPDRINPIQIGSSRNLNGNNYHGNIDEVAIYTNALSAAQVLNHYNAAFNVSPYSTTILADNPYMYWRMDSPGYTAPSMTNYPVATNYGNYPTALAALYGTDSQPGFSGPQYPGMLDPNNGNQSLAVAVNGIGGNNGDSQNIQYGYDTNGNPVFLNDAVPMVITNLSQNADPNAVLLDPTNHAKFSFTVWFRSNPSWRDHFETIVGHSDSGWRLNMNTGGTIRWNPGAGGEVDTPYTYNDAQWHQFVGTYDGSNILTYVDGLLVQTTVNTNVNAGTPLFPILGGAPDYLSSGNNYGVHNGYSIRSWSGSLAHFAFFTNVITAAQIQNLYAVANPNQAPYILSQPTSGRVNPPPGFLFFGVVAGGTGPLAYQWYYNAVSNYSGATQLNSDGVKYVGTTTSQMTISNLVASDSGYYFVVITNNSGSVTSSLATLTVNYNPVITAQNPLGNFTLYAGQTFGLSVSTTAETNYPLSYYWYTNSVLDVNGTNSSYNIGPVTLNNNGESYYAVVSNAVGTATSSPVTLTVLPMPAFLTNSSFSSNILQMAPTAYWPMHDSGQTPALGSVETNLGTWGQAANAYYDDWRQAMLGSVGNILGNSGVTNDEWLTHGFPGAIAGDSDSSVSMSGQNRSYLVVPRASAITIQPPFTLEAWVKPFNNRGFWIILGTDQGTLNSSSSRGGFDWLYSGTSNSFSMTVYNGTNANSTEPKTAINYPPGVWYHVVTTFDGTNVQYYINGQADDMSGGVTTNATLNPNTWDPITIGCGRGLNNNLMQGAVDEIAVYTNLLPVSEIQKHYNDGTNAAYANYKQDVLNDSPVLYYRMDAPTWTVPPLNTWPVLTNYGAVGVNGLYTPGAVPAGGPGPSEDGHPIGGIAATNSLQVNGCSVFADALNSPAYHPASRAPITLAAWVKGNPADVASHNWQGFVAEGDGGWRLNFNGGNGRANFNPGGAGGDVGNSTTSGANITMNDGNWHYVVGTYDGTVERLWVDGILSSTNSSTSGTSTKNFETFLGGYPANPTSPYPNTPTSLGNEVERVLAGSMCEAAFWNGTALSSNQIQALYSSLQVGAAIVRQPISASANERASFTNSILASGSTPLTYQWYKDGLPMPVGGQTNLPFGATNATLIISPVLPSDQDTNYYVVAANAYGSATSVVWSINPVFTIPVITNDILNTNAILFVGGHDSFSILAVGAQPIMYQWYSNNVAISGATSTRYNLLNAQPAGSLQNYYCVASNFLGTATSQVATIIVTNFPTASYPQTVLADNPIGFWRLNEAPDNGTGNDGVISYDSWGGNNGIYTNALINQFPGYDTNCDATQPFVQFGITAFSNSLVFNISTNLDFASSNNAEFSVECWVNGFAQTTTSGILDKGSWGAEEFTIDTGAANHAFRLTLRTANGTIYTANSTNTPDGSWHHLVGVVDEANGVATFYVDSLATGSTAVPSGAGILASPYGMTIGARSGVTGQPFAFTQQWNGDISDVSAYNYALTSTQVRNHYDAACVPAHVGIQPTNTWASENGNASFSAVTIGTPAISNQWFIGSPGFGTPIIGATNLTLVLSNLSAATNGNTFYIEAANQYGTNDSLAATLTIISGAPVISNNVPTNIVALLGEGISIPITAYGTLPLYYQWQVGNTNGQNFVNLSDTARISGSQTSTLTIGDAGTNDVGTYQVIVTNNFGFTTSSVALLTVVPAPLNFFNGLNNLGWGTNGSARFYGSNVLVLTDNSGGNTSLGNGSAWFGGLQYIGAWQATFTYIAGGDRGADGVTFCLQNDPRGTAALGGGGGSLGVSGINPSWELELNIYSPNVIGYSIDTGGAIGPDIPGPGTIALNSGDPIQVNMLYASGQLALTFTDLVSAATYNTNVLVGDLTQIVGGQTALVGFTGAYGAVHATQTITNFNFVSLTSASIKRNPDKSVTISWPGIIGGYTLQQSPSLSAPNWTAVTNQDVYSNGQHNITVPTFGTTNEFYRLNSPF